MEGGFLMKHRVRHTFSLLFMLLCAIFMASGFSVNASAATARIQFTSVSQKTNCVMLRWKPVSGAYRYTIIRTDAKPNGAIFASKAVQKSTTGTSFDDTNTGTSSCGNVYQYSVNAYNRSGNKIGYGTTFIVKVSSTPITTCTSNGSDGVMLKWSKVDKASGYRVQWVKGTVFSGSGMKVKYSGPNTLGTYINGLEKGQVYSFRVQAKATGTHKNNSYQTISSYSATCTKSFKIPEVTAKIVLHYNNGEVYRTIDVIPGSSYTLPCMSNPSGYTFMGWGRQKGMLMSQSRPLSLAYEAYAAMNNVKGTVHLYAVLMRRSDEPDLTDSQLSSPDLSAYKKVIFVGDSRTVRMERTLTAQNINYRKKNVAFIGKVGEGLVWFQNTGYQLLLNEINRTNMNDPRPIAVVFSLGVNNLSVNPVTVSEQYISYLRGIAPNLQEKNCRLFFMSVNPVNSIIIQKSLTLDRKEWRVRTFNGKVASGLSGTYAFINTYSWLMKTGYSTDNGSAGKDIGIDDGLHYTTRTYKRIYLKALQYLALS